MSVAGMVAAPGFPGYIHVVVDHDIDINMDAA